MRKLLEELNELYNFDELELELIDEKYDDAFAGISANMDAIAYNYDKLYDILSHDLNSSSNIENIIETIGETPGVLLIKNTAVDSEMYVLEPRESLDDAMIGCTQTGRAVYDYELLVKAFMKGDEMTESDAEEWISYNTLRTLPYLYERGPYVIMMLNVNEISE